MNGPRLPLLLALGAALGGLLWQAGTGAGALAPQGLPRAMLNPEAPASGSEAGSTVPDPWEGAAAAFPPLPAPGPGDWLAQHPEAGQTYEEFCEAARREPTPERRRLRLQPLEAQTEGDVELRVLAEHLALCYGLPAEASPAARPEGLTTRIHRGTAREQLLTGPVLRWLLSEMRSSDLAVLAVTRRDLYPQDSWSFVFGQASLRHGTGVFSFARMDPDFPAEAPPLPEQGAERRRLVLRRCLKVVTHETGHMLGLEHCIAHLCLMNGSNHVAEMDRAPLHLCPPCLRKVRFATGVDLRARYAALEAWYREAGLAEEARFAQARGRAMDRAARR